MKIFDFINKLDELGNYRLADKIDNEVRKVYAQAFQQTPGIQGNNMINPDFGFILNKILMDAQANMNKKDTDTLTPTKTPDLTSIQKKLNALTSNYGSIQKDVKKLNQNYDMIPNLSSMIGNNSEKIDQASNTLTTNTNEINDINQDIDVLYEAVESLPE